MPLKSNILVIFAVLKCYPIAITKSIGNQLFVNRMGASYTGIPLEMAYLAVGFSASDR